MGRPVTGLIEMSRDLAHHRLEDVKGERLVRAMRCVERDGLAPLSGIGEPVEELDTSRRLRIDEVDVGEVPEAQERVLGAVLAAFAGFGELGPADVRLTGTVGELEVGADRSFPELLTFDDRLAEGRHLGDPRDQMTAGGGVGPPEPGPGDHGGGTEQPCRFEEIASVHEGWTSTPGQLLLPSGHGG